LTVSMPRQSGNELFLTSFYNGSTLLRFTNGIPSVVWQTKKASERDTTHLHSIISTPFIEGDYVYGSCSYGQYRCLRLSTGERLWESFLPTGGKQARWANAFTVKNGSRFVLFSETGELILAKLSPSGFEELSRAAILDPTNPDPGRKVVWSLPAFANRSLYARNDEELVCVDLSAGAPRGGGHGREGSLWRLGARGPRGHGRRRSFPRTSPRRRRSNAAGPCSNGTTVSMTGLSQPCSAAARVVEMSTRLRP
jgi:PQQ-like domain